MKAKYNPKLDIRQPCFSSYNKRPCILFRGHKPNHISVEYRDSKGKGRLEWWWENPAIEYGEINKEKEGLDK